MAPVFKSASIAICLPGIASSVKRAVTSDTRSEPLLITSNCMITNTKNTIAPTTKLPPPTKLPNVSSTIPASAFSKIFLVELTFNDNRNNVVKSSNVGNADISRGSLENNALNKIIIESAIFNANNKSSKKSGTGIIKHKIGTKINAPNTISSRRIAFPPLRFFYQNQLTFPCNPYT